MKVISLLVFYIFIIEYIQCQKPIRTYAVLRDDVIRFDRLISYTVYDSNRIKSLFKLKSSSARDIDTIEFLSYPNKNMTANLEGEWAYKVFNVTSSIYDNKLNKWNEESIYKNKKSSHDVYTTRWNSIQLYTKRKMFFKTMQVFTTLQNKLFAEIRKRKSWVGDVRFEVKIYSNECPDAIYFFLMAINDHREQYAKLVG